MVASMCSHEMYVHVHLSMYVAYVRMYVCKYIQCKYVWYAYMVCVPACDSYVRTYVHVSLCVVYVHGSKIGRNGLIKDNLRTMGERGQVIGFLIL